MTTPLAYTDTSDKTRGNLSHRETKFWDRVADGYAKKAIANEGAYQHKLAKTREYLSPDASLLEIGCGTGSTAIEHAPLVKEITATDISGRMLEIAEKKARTAGTGNITFLQYGAGEALCSGKSYDVVLALNLLHLLSDWRDVVHRAHSALKPGGVLVSSTLCLAEQHAWLRYIAPLGRRLNLMPDIVAFKGEELKAVHLLDGFDIEYEWQADARSGLFLIARRL